MVRQRPAALNRYEAAARTLKLHILSLKLSAPEPNLQAAFEVAAKGTSERAHYFYWGFDYQLPEENCGACQQEPHAIYV